MTIIAGIISIALGVFLWIIPQIRFEREDGKFVLRGDRKRLMAWLFIMSGIVPIMLRLDFFVIFLAAIVITFIAVFSAEPDQQVRAAFQPPPNRPVPRTPQPYIPTPRTVPKSEQLPVPKTLTTDLRQMMELVAQRGKLQFDYRYQRDDAMYKRCLTLEKMGYLQVTETGPGDSIEIFKPTDAALELLTAPTPPVPSAPPKPVQPPQSRILTDELRSVLQSVAESGRVSFDTRFKSKDERYLKCRNLANLGYLTIDYDGPGDAIEFYSPTDKGRNALTEN